MVGNASVTKRNLETNGSQQQQNSTTRTHNSSSKRSNNKPRKGEGDFEPDELTLWKRPLTTLNYFLRELVYDSGRLARSIYRYKHIVFIAATFLAIFIAASRLNGPQQQVKNNDNLIEMKYFLSLIFFFAVVQRVGKENTMVAVLGGFGGAVERGPWNGASHVCAVLGAAHSSRDDGRLRVRWT